MGNRQVTTTELPEVVPLTPEKTIEEVWQQPGVGSPWRPCSHEEPRAMEYDDVLDSLYEIGLGKDEEWLTHPQVVRIAMDLWGLEAVCAFFHLGIEDAARRVHGEVAEKYPFEEGLAITKDFSDYWNGCPEQLCGGNWDEYGEMEFPRVSG